MDFMVPILESESVIFAAWLKVLPVIGDSIYGMDIMDILS